MTSSEQIDKHIADNPGWKGDIMSKLRKLILEADPEMVEEWKWDTPVFTHNKMVCAIGAFKDHVKINFFKGALLKDPHKLINAGLDSKQHRSIDFHEGDALNDSALIQLIQEAVSLNK